jgi:hypothetical protein
MRLLEDVLIVSGLTRFGGDQGEATGQYGILRGMVMPLLIFPHETDTRASEPAPSPHIKNYFNSIDHKAYV